MYLSFEETGLHLTPPPKKKKKKNSETIFVLNETSQTECSYLKRELDNLIRRRPIWWFIIKIRKLSARQMTSRFF